MVLRTQSNWVGVKHLPLNMDPKKNDGLEKDLCFCFNYGPFKLVYMLVVDGCFGC